MAADKQLPNLRRWLVIAGILVALVAAYAATGFFAVPRLVRAQVVAFVAENYGREAAIGEVRFNPFTLELEAHNFSMPDQDGERLLAFDRLLVNLDVASLWRLAISFTSIELERPFARVLIRPDGSLNLADLSRLPTAPTADPPAQNEPLRLVIDDFRVSAGAVKFEDHTRAAPFHARLEPIAFDLTDFSTLARTGNTYSLRASSSLGERLAWDGTVSVAPLASRGRFELTDVLGRTLWAYLRENLGFEIASGRMAVTGEYDFAAGEAVQLKLDVHNVSVADLALRPPGGEIDYVHLASLLIDKTHLDFARRRVEVGRITLAGGTVRAWRDAQGINLLALVPANERESTVTEPPSTWVLAAPEIAVDDLRVEIEDRLVQPVASFVLAPVDVTVAGFTSAADTELEVDAKIGIDESGRLAARLKTMPAGAPVTGTIELTGFYLPSLQPYLNTYTQLTLIDGALDAKLDVERTAGGELAVKGDSEIARLHAIDNALRQDLLKWDRVKLAGLEYESNPAGFKIATITAQGPYARLIIAADQSLNLRQVLAPASGDSKPAAPAPDGPAELPIRIGTVRITNGSANFADFWIQPNYAVSVQGLSGTIVGLSSDPKSRAKVNLEGKVDRYAPAAIGGEINLLSAALYTDVKVSFKGVEMTSVTPYSGRFAGYKIEKGKLSIDVAYKVQDRKLDAQQRFVIDQLQLGERVESPDAVNLPLKLAVALLKDRNGVIDLDLPVSGSLDDPKFRLGPIIWKAIVGLLTKIATAPFALLGSLFGGGEEMNIIEFAPGDATLDPAGQERMASVRKALEERPQLQLDVPVPYAEIDQQVLAARKLDERLLSLARQSASARKRPAMVDETSLTDPKKRFDLLLAQYRLDFGAQTALPPAAVAFLESGRKEHESHSLEAVNAELAAALAAKVPVTTQDLEQLARARANAVQDALLASAEIDPIRIFILGATQTTPVEEKVRLELALK